MSRMIRLVVADERPMFCEGLVRAFRETKGFSVSGSATRGYDAWEIIKDKTPDVALLDLTLPGLTAVDIAERVTKKSLDVKVIVFANPEPSDHNVRRALAANVTGYILKTIEWRELLAVIRRVAGGDIVIGAQATAQLVQEIQYSSTKPVKDRLTPQERKVLSLLARGETAIQIADDLTISKYTVREHLQQIYEKLEVQNAPEAVAEGMRKGLIK